MSFQDHGLMAELLRAVGAQGYTTPTPIQSRAIPAILAGRDVMAAAQTGTGKTAGFTLPMLQRLMAGHGDTQPRRVRALVLTPTRELAAQVEDSVRRYGADLPLRSMSCFGGVGMQPQVDRLRRGVDVLVATPGRLLDHLQRGTLELSGIEILVLDEADRMLDMGFIHDIRRVLKALPSARQTLLFSATFSDDIVALADGLLRTPERIDVAPRNSAADTVEQRVYAVHKHDKRALLQALVSAGDWQQVLVFARTKHGADRLAKQLDRDGLTATAIHGNKSQGARTRALREFKDGGVRILVATDIAARGLDIDQLPHVVNFELPNVPEDYVHRIGRTGRAGRGGEAISLVSPDEATQLRDIERLLGRALARAESEGFEAVTMPAASGGDTGRGRRAGRGSPPSRQARHKHEQGHGAGHGRRRRSRRRNGAQPRPGLAGRPGNG
jgi:ATP-dependent RNA helicase RhlE